MTPMYIQKRDGEKSMRPQYYTKNSRQLKKTGKKGKVAFSREDYTNWLYRVKDHPS